MSVSNETTPREATEIVEFWFSDTTKKRWFDSTETFDRQIRDNYERLWQQGLAGELDHWAQTTEGALALVILLDQFPLNMFRDQPESFASEKHAREIARRALADHLHDGIDKEHLSFFFLPFMHSEEMEDQDLSVALYEGYGLDTRWAKHHREIVAEFGRFPHRNAILGRKNTDAEQAYLGSERAFKG